MSYACKPRPACKTMVASRESSAVTATPEPSPVEQQMPQSTSKATRATAKTKQPVDFAGPSKLSLVLPWLAVALMTSAAAAFYAMPEGKLSELLAAPTLSIAAGRTPGSRVIPQNKPREAQITQPLHHPSPDSTGPETKTVLTPVWETKVRDEVYTIRKPVVETTYREEKYTITEPVTTYAPQAIDQGQWVEQTVAKPGEAQTRIKWVKGGWTTNEVGQTYWQIPGPRLAKEAGPATYTTMRVWQPNVVTQQIPQVSYKPVTKTRQVPVQSVRFVEEQRVRKVPERVCRLVEKEVGSARQVSNESHGIEGSTDPDEESEMLSQPTEGRNKPLSGTRVGYYET
jgi:hypothetical protein